MRKRLFSGTGHEVTARLSALVLAGILGLSVLGYCALHFGWLDRGAEYEAEFQNAWPLVPGMDVRVSGAVVGSVRDVQLTNHGTALVTFQLRPGVPVPRADASVAIRQDDLLGDSDLSLELGTARAPLQGVIPVSRSIQEPRLDDFLNIFRAPVRAGLQTFLVEVGTAMENRGEDVNQAILELRPGFQALGNVFVALQDQIGSLKQIIDRAHSVTSQLAGRSHDLGQLVDGLGRTLGSVAAQSTQLDQGIAQLPTTLTETQSTMDQLTGLTHSVTPLAQTLARYAPGFAATANRLSTYAQALRTAGHYATPTVTLAGDTLRAAAPTAAALSRLPISDLLNPAAGLFAALKPVFDNAATAIFGSPSGVGGLGGVVVPGNDLTAPNTDPARDYIGAYLVVGCQLFGVPPAPGCLSKVLSSYFPATTAGAKTPSTPATVAKPAATATPTTPAAAPSTSPAGAAAPATGATGATGPAAILNPTNLSNGLQSLLGFLLKR